MAEFCLECLNKQTKYNLTEKHVSLDIDFCEGCSQWKPCVIRIKRYPSKSDSFFIKLFEFFNKKRL